VELGPEVGERQRPGARVGLDEPLDEVLALRVEPVEVLEEDHERLLRTPPFDESPEDGTDPPHVSLGRHWRN
jgi:hypothetical protein